MSDIRKLPAVVGRVETGTVQFGGDWPGVFLRGDYAGPMAALYLKGAIEKLKTTDYSRLYIMMLENLMNTLQNSDVRNHEDTTPSQTALKVEAAMQEGAKVHVDEMLKNGHDVVGEVDGKWVTIKGVMTKHDEDCDSNDGSICFCGYAEQQQEHALKKIKGKEKDPSSW